MDASERGDPPGVEAPWARLRLAALLLLTASVPLAGQWAMPVAGTAHEHERATLAIFDIILWPSAALVVLSLWRQHGPRRGLRNLLGLLPVAGLAIALLGAWAGLVWPRLTGQVPPGCGAFVSKMVPNVEYGVAGFIAFAGLMNGERQRELALRVLAAGVGAALLWGLGQYFLADDLGRVGSFMGNRASWGAFLAVAVPFFAVLALCTGRAWWRWTCAAIAVLGVIQVTTLGAMLGVLAAMVLAGAILRGRAALLAGACLAGALAIGQLLPRHNLSAALENARFEKKCPKTGRRLVAMRYLRGGAELNVLRAPFREDSPDWRMAFGFGPGGYGRSKTYRPALDDRPGGETNQPDNLDVLADEPGTFNLFGVAGVEMGWLGVLAFVALFATCGARVLRSWRDAAPGTPAKALALAALAGLVGAVVVAPFSSVWIRGAGPMLALLCALGAAGPAVPEDPRD